MNTLLVNATRFFFSVASRTFPFLAVRVAERLFTTPFQPKRQAIEKEILEEGEKFAIPFRDNLDLAGYRWGDGSSHTVLLVHGWRATASCFISFVDPLVSRGFQVVSYDVLAHGESPGNSVSLTEWADTVLAALEELGPVHCIIGHSVGGGAVVIASSLGLNTDRIVLISPVSDIVKITERFADTLYIPKKTIEGMRDYAWKKYHQSASKYGSNWDDVFRSSFKVPTLILHDKDDKEISWENGKAIADLWPWAKFISTEGLGHRRILLNPDVVSTVANFVGG